MKRIIYTICLLCCLCAVGCDVLDVSPTDMYSEETVWSSEQSVDYYVYGFYGGMIRETLELNSSMGQFTDAYSDIVKSGDWDGHSYNKALLQESYFNSSDAGCFACWSDCYGRIRRHNEFLEMAPKYMEKFGEDFIITRMAEIRFIRAYAYYRLIRVYGGVVLRTELDGPEQNDKARSSELDSWKQVVSDLNYAVEHLPESWDPAYEGRLTKAAAYAMLSRVGLFYAASDPAGAASEGWQITIDAAAECAKYSSLAQGENAYADVFSDSSLDENILVVYYTPYDITHRADMYFRPSGDGAVLETVLNTCLFPTSELVDSYEMADGSEFSWETHGDDPYTGREPRFYATILYNGAEWEGRRIETYEGGADGIVEFDHIEGRSQSTTTGYYLRKWLTEGSSDWLLAGSTHFYPVFRYAEVLLNKAEALAQQDWGANGDDALECLNEIRSRVGLGARSASSLDEFMEYLRHERMIELAGEGFRYWDIRRWRMGEEVIQGKNAHGCWITRTVENEGTAGETETLSYRQVNVDADYTRVFLERYYAFSIPQSERANNSLIGENNFGW